MALGDVFMRANTYLPWGSFQGMPITRGLGEAGPVAILSWTCRFRCGEDGSQGGVSVVRMVHARLSTLGVLIGRIRRLGKKREVKFRQVGPDVTRTKPTFGGRRPGPQCRDWMR